MTWRLFLAGWIMSFGCVEADAGIDRRALVERHSPHITAVDPWAPLSVGNGKFAFTADATGLQTLAAHYHARGIPVETQARWSWYSDENSNGYALADANRAFEAYGKTVHFPTNAGSPAGMWLRENPRDMPLTQIAFERVDGREISAGEIRSINQKLDLWSGTLRSSFVLDGEKVDVVAAVHPSRDALALRIESAAVRSGKLAVALRFPRGHDPAVKLNAPLDWSAPESHATRIARQGEREFDVVHSRDASTYHVRVASAEPLQVTRTGPHALRIAGDRLALLDLVMEFTPGESRRSLRADEVRSAATSHWEKFWQTGGAIDFSGSVDPRARELERRVVLSQYLTAIQFAGEFPPQEGGLTSSTWYGKHHTEMIWWHTAHFALWGRDRFLATNLDLFVEALPRAREIAAGRGLKGSRWPKMVGPDWRESPGGNPLIVWNQPHPVHLAELLYRNSPNRETLERYRTLVFETADCMASMLHWDESNQRYNLGPPLWIAQEIYDQARSMNPTYELSYWVRGLKIAQQWRERLGLERDGDWDERILKIARLPTKDGKYVAIESDPDTWNNKDSRHDHPSFLMAYGQIPGDGVDVPTMRRTLDAVISTWDFETKIWGWDYPMIAMTAARLGEANKAVDLLLFARGPNNKYMPNGHCPQRDDLPVYLPANGALLAAVAMMAAGWDDAPSAHAPGFPNDGSWVVHAEGLKRLP